MGSGHHKDLRSGGGAGGRAPREIQMWVVRQGMRWGLTRGHQHRVLLGRGGRLAGLLTTTGQREYSVTRVPAPSRMRGAQLPPQAGRALCLVTPAMAAGEWHPHGAEPVSSQTGDDGWSPMQAREGWRPPGKAARTQGGPWGRGSGAGPQGDKRAAPPYTGASCHLAPPPGPSIIRPSSSSAGRSSSSPTLGLTPGKRSPASVSVPTCTLPSAKTGEEGTPDWLLAAAGLGSWDQAPKRHLRLQWGHCSAHRHAGPQPEASNPHPPSLPKSDST